MEPAGSEDGGGCGGEGDDCFNTRAEENSNLIEQRSESK